MKKQAFLSSILFLGMVTINALANIIPINGYNTGEVSSFYPNLFVPDGFTFSIWAIIYLLLGVYVIKQWQVAFAKHAHRTELKILSTTNPLFWLTCVLNMVWIMAWHHLYIGISIGIMLVFLGTLIAIVSRQWHITGTLSGMQRTTLVLPFTIYLGWISVATIANTTALLVHLGWQGGPMAPQNWSATLIIITLLLVGYMVVKLKQAAYGLVVAWALAGIYRSQITQNPNLGYIALTGMAVAGLLSIFIAIRNKRLV